MDDDLESPSYALMDKLEKKDVEVFFNDPHVPVIIKTRSYSKFAGRKSQNSSKHYDLFLIETAHGGSSPP